MNKTTLKLDRPANRRRVSEPRTAPHDEQTKQYQFRVCFMYGPHALKRLYRMQKEMDRLIRRN